MNAREQNILSQNSLKFYETPVGKPEPLRVEMKSSTPARGPKSPAVRTHRCDKCNLVLDRDHNAAINILKKGLDIFGIVLDMKLPQEVRELTPVAISKRSLKQEATSFTEW